MERAARVDDVSVDARLEGRVGLRSRSSVPEHDTASRRQATTGTELLTAGCALSFFNLGAWGALYAITPEIYPTSVRGAGAGAAAGFGRIASIIAPFAVPFVLAASWGGQGVVFTIFAASFLLAAAAA